MYVTAPESDATLQAFYQKVRPAGPGWTQVRLQLGVEDSGNLGRDGLRVIAAAAVLFGMMFAIGGALLLKVNVAAGMFLIAVAGWVGLRRLG